MLKGYGEVIKEIRIGKGYTQKYVANGLITQGAYSKIENKNIELTMSSMHNILDQLEVSFDEFIYIQNGYKHSDRDELVKRFFHTPSNHEENIKELYKTFKDFLKSSNNDKLIHNISIVLYALIILSDTSDFEQAKALVAPVWEDLSNRGQLFISDLYLLNSILFLFPLSTALEIKKFAFRHITLYENFRNVKQLQINISLNIVLMLIKNNNYLEALEDLVNIIEICKQENMFIHLAISYVRKGICLNHLGQPGKEWIIKGRKILDVLEQFQVVEALEKEIERSKNKR